MACPTGTMTVATDARGVRESRTGTVTMSVSRRTELLAVSIPMLLGILVRVAPVAGAGFPVGDGGMFYVMVQEIQHAGMAIPATTAYNHAGIPFAYPPLGLWMTALLGNGLPVPLLTIFQWWPVLCSILMLPVFYLLARRLLGSWFPAVLALGAFALLPRSFETLIDGGGVTRAPGYLFALIAMYAMVAALGTGRRRFVAVAAAAAGLAIMTHPNAALVTVVSLAALAALGRPSRRSLVTLAIVLAGAAVVSAPWWLVDLLRFGAAPLLSAAGAGSQLGPVAGVVRLLAFDFAEEPFLPWITALGAAGLAWCLARRRFLLPVWLVAVLLVDATAAPTDATIPLALLAAIGLVDIVLPALAHAATVASDASGGLALLGSRPARLTLIVVAGLAFLGATYRPLEVSSMDHTLPSDVRASMAWVAANTPADATFAVVTGRDWFSDNVSEWFPALAGRRSVATVQGYEWLGNSGWWRRQDLDADLQACAAGTDTCLATWMRRYGVAPAYVYLPKGQIGGPLSAGDCCGALRQTLAVSPDYLVAYDGPGATIFKKRKV
jgi:Dolichyl-phosphate-mannose-protein mannosyltransferase